MIIRSVSFIYLFCYFFLLIENSFEDKPYDICNGNICANGGTCIPVYPNTFTCVCPFGFTGSLCDYPEGINMSTDYLINTKTSFCKVLIMLALVLHVTITPHVYQYQLEVFDAFVTQNLPVACVILQSVMTPTDIID